MIHVSQAAAERSPNSEFKMRLAIADTDPEVLHQIGMVAVESGHDCLTFSDGREMITALSRETFDMVLLDWDLPDVSGLEILQRAQEKLENPPTFILLTNRGDKGDVEQGLEAGASDYIVKPESSEIIRARIDAAARTRFRAPSKRFDDFGPYRIDHLEKSICFRGEPVKLTAKEFRLAVLFFENINRPLSRGYIFSQVWNAANDLETRTLDMHMSRVRAKLALRPENGFVIQTVFGFGYRMDALQDN